jgi:predicted nucleic acid-binding protein
VKGVFVDTSGFYGVLDGTDSFHDVARACWSRARAESWRLLTTSYVIHESWAVIQARLGWEALDAWRDRLVPGCQIVWVDETLHRLGEARCRQARERRLSLTDCISIEVMRQHGVREYIGQDDHFSREGFALP